MAALIKQELQLETDLEPGSRGEFSVWIDGRKIAEKTRTSFPTEPAIIAAIKEALA